MPVLDVFKFTFIPMVLVRDLPQSEDTCIGSYQWQPYCKTLETLSHDFSITFTSYERA